MTQTTYTDQEPRAIAWAAARHLLHPDGTADQATPDGQHAKTCEEIGEASLELRKLAKTRVIAQRLMAMKIEYLADASSIILGRRRHRLAMELGDILVTLALQAAMADSSLEECLVLANVMRTDKVWALVDIHAKGIAAALRYPEQNPYLLNFIGLVARCVEDVARTELCLSGPQCLALALNKIERRKGKTVGGIFVKCKVTGDVEIAIE
jgi:NTP pyrophosphatase (non-canonical NTP hydrolase)